MKNEAHLFDSNLNRIRSQTTQNTSPHVAVGGFLAQPPETSSSMVRAFDQYVNGSVMDRNDGIMTGTRIVAVSNDS